MPNDEYLDASVRWRIKSGTLDLHEASYRSTVDAIISSGLATDVVGLISAGKEANVYLASYKAAPIAVKCYRLYTTSHKGGRPVKLDTMGWKAAKEYEMTHQAWRGGARVPAPARRVENMFSMRYLGDDAGPAPRLSDMSLEDPEGFLGKVMSGVESLARSGVVHTDLSPYNILVHSGEPWFIDLSEALRVDRTGGTPWVTLTKAESALNSGMSSLAKYFERQGVEVEYCGFVRDLVDSLDRFGVMR
ncbi:MAG: RIO1 family regulatory kinase/ATPase [Thermoplasmata archaeon]